MEDRHAEVRRLAACFNEQRATFADVFDYESDLDHDLHYGH